MKLQSSLLCSHKSEVTRSSKNQAVHVLLFNRSVLNQAAQPAVIYQLIILLRPDQAAEPILIYQPVTVQNPSCSIVNTTRARDTVSTETYCSKYIFSSLTQIFVTETTSYRTTFINKVDLMFINISDGKEHSGKEFDQNLYVP